MRKEDITRHPYLSCIEAYYLAWLSQYTDVRRLYCRSFIELGEVADDFTAGAQYATYDTIPRLQDFGEELEITNHTRRVRFACGPQNALTLMRVRPLFFGSSVLPWRNDHYIAVTRNARRGYDYINQYPLSCGVLSPSERVAAYDGVTIVYRYTGHWDEKMYAECRQEEFKALRNPIRLPQTDKLFGTELRDALGILRAVRERTYRWLQYEGIDLPVLAEQIRQLDKLYFKVSTDILRGKSGESYAEAWENIIQSEMMWRKEI